MSQQPDTLNGFRACPQCGSLESQISFASDDHMLNIDGPFYVSKCKHCGFMFQNPSLRPEHLTTHYPDSYSPYSLQEMEVNRSGLWYLKHRKGYAHLTEPPAMNRLKQIWGRWSSGMQLLPAYIPNGHVLEIACASGGRLALLRRLGWAFCTGSEYSEYAAGLAAARGFEVHTGRVEDTLASIPDQSQDVVIASFVMEHLEDPFGVTKQVAAKIGPKGQFIFSTINIDSLDFSLYRKYWYSLDLPRHYSFFRKQDLRKMLEPYFEISEIYFQPAPNDYTGSARYRLKHSRTHSLVRALDEATVSLGDRLWYFCLALSLLGKATRIVIHARKR